MMTNGALGCGTYVVGRLVGRYYSGPVTDAGWNGPNSGLRLR